MENSFYQDSLIILEGAIANVTSKIEIYRKYKEINNQRDPVEFITSRIKSEESMKEKLKRKGFDVTKENALTKVYDAAGLRVICYYIDDVYEIANMLKNIVI